MFPSGSQQKLMSEYPPLSRGKREMFLCLLDQELKLATGIGERTRCGNPGCRRARRDTVAHRRARLGRGRS